MCICDQTELSYLVDLIFMIFYCTIHFLVIYLVHINQFSTEETFDVIEHYSTSSHQHGLIDINNRYAMDTIHLMATCLITYTVLLHIIPIAQKIILHHVIFFYLILYTYNQMYMICIQIYLHNTHIYSIHIYITIYIYIYINRCYTIYYIYIYTLCKHKSHDSIHIPRNRYSDSSKAPDSRGAPWTCRISKSLAPSRRSEMSNGKMGTSQENHRKTHEKMRKGQENLQENGKTIGKPMRK